MTQLDRVRQPARDYRARAITGRHEKPSGRAWQGRWKGEHCLTRETDGNQCELQGSGKSLVKEEVQQAGRQQAGTSDGQGGALEGSDPTVNNPVQLVREGDGVVNVDGDEIIDQNSDEEVEAGNDISSEAGPILSGEEVASKFKLVDRMLSKLDSKSEDINSLVSGLRASLKFSQKEIDTLKEDNKHLRDKIEDMETEEQRTAYQMKKIEDKVDKVETVGGGEDVMKTVWGVLDQMNIGRGVELDTCYREGGYSKNRPRPINISFTRQSDRDLVFSKRTELR